MSTGGYSLSRVLIFSGIINYYCRFKPNCSEVLQPLTGFPKKGSRKFSMTPEATMVLKTAKEALSKVYVLGSINVDNKAVLVLETDVSTEAFGVELQQIIDGARQLYVILLTAQFKYGIFGHKLLTMSCNKVL